MSKRFNGGSFSPQPAGRYRPKYNGTSTNCYDSPPPKYKNATNQYSSNTMHSHSASSIQLMSQSPNKRAKGSGKHNSSPPLTINQARSQEENNELCQQALMHAECATVPACGSPEHQQLPQQRGEVDVDIEVDDVAAADAQTLAYVPQNVTLHTRHDDESASSSSSSPSSSYDCLGGGTNGVVVPHDKTQPLSVQCNSTTAADCLDHSGTSSSSEAIAIQQQHQHQQYQQQQQHHHHMYAQYDPSCMPAGAASPVYMPMTMSPPPTHPHLSQHFHQQQQHHHAVATTFYASPPPPLHHPHGMHIPPPPHDYASAIAATPGFYSPVYQTPFQQQFHVQTPYQIYEASTTGSTSSPQAAAVFMSPQMSSSLSSSNSNLFQTQMTPQQQQQSIYLTTPPGSTSLGTVTAAASSASSSQECLNAAAAAAQQQQDVYATASNNGQPQQQQQQQQPPSYLMYHSPCQQSSNNSSGGASGPLSPPLSSSSQHHHHHHHMYTAMTHMPSPQPSMYVHSPPTPNSSSMSMIQQLVPSATASPNSSQHMTHHHNQQQHQTTPTSTRYYSRNRFGGASRRLYHSNNNSNSNNNNNNPQHSQSQHQMPPTHDADVAMQIQQQMQIQMQMQQQQSFYTMPFATELSQCQSACLDYSASPLIDPAIMMVNANGDLLAQPPPPLPLPPPSALVHSVSQGAAASAPLLADPSMMFIDSYAAAAMANSTDPSVVGAMVDQDPTVTTSINEDVEDANEPPLACYVCRGRRMCFCYFLKVRYYKFPSFLDLVDHQYKKWRTHVNKNSSRLQS